MRDPTTIGQWRRRALKAEATLEALQASLNLSRTREFDAARTAAVRGVFLTEIRAILTELDEIEGRQV